MGHLEVKYKGKEGARYERETVRLFENYLKRIGGFKEAVWAREKKKREENEMIRLKEAEVTANKFTDVIKLALGKESKVMPGATTQLVKSRQPPL